MNNLSKKQKRDLRDFSGMLYEKELHQALEQLFKKFVMWNKGELGSFDLDNDIHTYKKGIARELYVKYISHGNDSFILSAVIARCVVDGLTTIEQVPESIREMVGRNVDFINEV